MNASCEPEGPFSHQAPRAIDSFEGEYFFLSNFCPPHIVINFGSASFLMPNGEHAFH